ncbi:glycosyltransferase [Desulfovulcanus sp.]
MSWPLICHYSILKDQGGAAIVARTLCSFLQQRGWQSRQFWEIEGGGLKGLDKIGVKRIVHLHSTLNWPETLRYLIKRKDRVVITAHDCSLFTGGCPYPLDCSKWQSGCKGCQRGYAQAERLWQAKKSLVFDLKPIIVSPSKWLAKMINSIWPEIKVRIIPNGIFWEDSPHKGLSLGQKLNQFARWPTVLFVAHGGQKAVYKGGDRWLYLWQKIKQEAPGARALFVGGEEYAEIDGAYLLPYLSRDILFELMKRCRVLVYPTLADNHPLLILEAMSCKLPIVAFKIGGVSEQIVPGRTGILVEPGDWEELAQKVVYLLKNRHEAALLADMAFERARQFFSASRMVTEYIKVYIQISSGRSHA